MLTRLVTGLMCMVWVCRDAPQVEHTTTPVAEPASLRSEVREIIRPKCGSCHTSTLPTAKPNAVAIFDLQRDDWPSTISIKQFDAFKRRLSDLDESQRRKIDKFVSEEISRRTPAGS